MLLWLQSPEQGGSSPGVCAHREAAAVDRDPPADQGAKDLPQVLRPHGAAVAQVRHQGRRRQRQTHEGTYPSTLYPHPRGGARKFIQGGASLKYRGLA